MSDLLSRYQRDQVEEDAEPRNRFGSRRRGSEDISDGARTPARSVHEIDNDIESSNQVLTNTLNCLALVALALLILLLLNVLTKLTFRPVKDITVGIWNRRCAEGPAAINDVRAFNSSVKQVDLIIPSRVDFQYRQWLEENGWTKSRFSSRMNEILSQNFKSPSTVRGQLDFSSVIGETNPDRLRLIEEANYLKGIKDKLMDFASSRYAFTNAGFQSQEFNNLYRQHVQNFKMCRANIDQLKQKVLSKLNEDNSLRMKLRHLESKRDSLNQQLISLDNQINAKNKNLNQELDRVMAQIAQIEDRLRIRDKNASEISIYLAEIEKLQNLIPEIRRQISEKNQALIDYNNGLKDKERETSQLLRKRDKINGDILFIRKELSILYTNRDIQQIASKLGSGCDEDRINSLTEKFNEKIGEEKTIKQMIDNEEGDEEILKELNIFDEDKEVYKNIMKSYLNMKLAGKTYKLNEIAIKITELEGKRDAYMIDLSEIEQRLDAIKGEIGRIQIMIESTKTTIEGLNAKLNEINAEIVRLRALVDRLRMNINVDPSQLERLRLRAEALRRELEAAVGSLQKQKEDILRQLREIQDELLRIQDTLRGSNDTINGYIRELNTELNNCKRNEIMIMRFRQEYDAVVGKLKDDKRRIMGLKKELLGMLRAIEAY